MDQFVRVRLVQANRLDLSLFQFDYDLTFAVFLMNADRTVYGRYGTRSEDKQAEKDISIEGFRRALEGALALHAGYPGNRASLAGKQGRPTRYPSPDDYPSLKGKYGPALDYEGRLERSCLHCHQVREAERLALRDSRAPIPDAVLYPYPMPDVAGLSFDAREAATVRDVQRGSIADRAGVRPGDRLTMLDGQPLLSIADVQWVLHNAGSSASLDVVVQRGRRSVRKTLALPEGWRRRSDVSWRATTWDLRRMATGGLVLGDLDAAARRAAGLGTTALALRVNYIGQYGEHAAGKRAGFEEGDVIIAADGHSERLSEGGFLALLLQHRSKGSVVPVTVLRHGNRVELNLPQQ